MKNIILISLPKIETEYPPGALASIASIAKKFNRDVKIFDYNLTLFECLSDDEWSELEAWCAFAVDNVSTQLLKKLENVFVEHIKLLIDSNTEVVCFSVFSYFSNRVSELALQWFKQVSSLTTLVGGSGVSTDTSPTNKIIFGQHILDNNLANYVIFGEGEIAFQEFLNGNYNYFGINKDNPKQIENLSSLPTPTYEYFDMSRYNRKKILITGSRGCVRHCTFCDIDLTWPKFKFRNAKNIVDEMKKHFYEYGVKDFEFTDSLINGSITNFDAFNELLYNEKERNPDLKDIKYQGQFICRPKEQQRETSYELMNLAGCSMLTVGIESFSNNVRTHMKKKFSNSDIDYHFAQCARWAIPNVILMIVGYPTETLEDHTDNVNSIIKYQKYATMGTIFMIRWGMTMHLYEHTPIMSMVQDLDINLNNDIAFDSVYGWTCGSNTLKERIRRRLELHELCVKLGYPMPRVREELLALKKLAGHWNPSMQKKYFSLASK